MCIYLLTSFDGGYIHQECSQMNVCVIYMYTVHMCNVPTPPQPQHFSCSMLPPPTDNDDVVVIDSTRMWRLVLPAWDGKNHTYTHTQAVYMSPSP